MTNLFSNLGGTTDLHIRPIKDECFFIGGYMKLDVKEIFLKDYVGSEVIVEGWVRNHRKQKEFGFIDFSDGKAKWTKKLSCSEFVDFLYKFCNDYVFIRMLIKDNHIDIEHFNPNTGETSDIKITYKEIDNKDEK